MKVNKQLTRVSDDLRGLDTLVSESYKASTYLPKCLVGIKTPGSYLRCLLLLLFTKFVYILLCLLFQDNRGAPLERWQMCSKEEEPLVLQQFLRFGETRPITQQLILQELSERSNEEHRYV